MGNQSKMETIPLIKFPLLVIEEVMCTMCPFELINISLANGRLKNLVKSFAKRKPRYTLAPSIGREFGVEMKRGNIGWEYSITSNALLDGKTELFENHSFRSDTIYKYSIDPFSEFKMLCEHIQETFLCQIAGIHFEMHLYPDQNRDIIDWFKTRQPEFEYFEIYSETDTDEDLKYLLNNLKTSKILTIMSQIKKDFEVELPENIYDLSIYSANFVKLNQLLRLNYPMISLQTNSLTPSDIRTFLKSWMASESHLNLGYFKIGIKLNEVLVIFLDIPFTIVNAMDVKEFFFDDCSFTVRGGIDIKRNDGRTARMRAERHGSKVFLEMFTF